MQSELSFCGDVSRRAYLTMWCHKVFVAFYWFKNERKILLVFISHSFSFNGHISPYIFSVYF